MIFFKKISIVFGLTLIVLLATWSPAHAATCTNYYQPNVAVPTGYGAAYDVFSSGTLIVQGDCSGASPILKVGAANQSQYIYKIGYAYKGGSWQQVGLTGSGALISANWYAGSAQGTLPFTSADLTNWNYIVGYVCTWSGTAWKCGCADTACSTGNWQLQAINEASGGGGNPASGSRHYWEQPGGDQSVWNTPFGDGAIWGSPSDADTQDLRHGGIVNPATYFGENIYTGQASDPVKSVQTVNGSVNIHVPADAFASGGGDGNVDFMDPINQFGKNFHVYQAQIGGNSVTGSNLETADKMANNYGEDQETRLDGFDVSAGTITAYDFAVVRAGGHIRHGLRYSTDAMYLKNVAIDGVYELGPESWPNRHEDYQTPSMPVNNYSGNMSPGTTVGIPLSTPMPSGLTKGGQEIFWTMQHYPVIWRDQAGGGFHLNGDQISAGDSLMDDVRKDLPAIVQLLLPLRNQHVGGQSFTAQPKNGPGNRVDGGPPVLSNN